MHMDYSKRAKKLGHKIEKYYRPYGAEIGVTGVQIIYDLRRYIYTICFAPGTRIKAIFTYAEEVQVALGLPLFCPFREGNHIRIAVSEYTVKENSLLKILRSPVFRESDIPVPYAIGYDLWGNMCIVDLVKLRHLLIAGPTGTGKSVALWCLIISIIFQCPVSSVNLLLFDIGGGSLSLFHDLTHLSHPIVEDIETGMQVLEALVLEMDDRYTLAENELQHRPYLVCIIDEFDSIISNIDNKKESQKLVNLLNNLLRRGRKAKIIMVLASHNPTLKNVKVDLGMITARISFYYTKHQSSSTALGMTGAHKLSGAGAMMFKSQEGIQSLQGAFITPEEIRLILDHPPVDYDDSNKFVPAKPDADHTPCIVFGGNIPIQRDTKELADIIVWALKRDTISAIQVQRQFKMGNRAATIVEELFKLGIVGEKFANQPRKVIPHKVEDLSPEAIELLKKHGIDTDSTNPAEDNLVT